MIFDDLWALLAKNFLKSKYAKFADFQLRVKLYTIIQNLQNLVGTGEVCRILTKIFFIKKFQFLRSPARAPQGGEKTHVFSPPRETNRRFPAEKFWLVSSLTDEYKIVTEFVTSHIGD